MAVSTRRTGTAAQRETTGPPMPPRPPARQPQPPNDPPPPEPIFALTPALATRGIIDYSSRAGEKIYSSATKELDPKRYDGEAQGLMAFLELLEERAANFGWDSSTMMVPDYNRNPVNLLSGYGTITLA